MALGHSPRIVTDGLVLCLDGASKKSFKGEATTNILTNGNFSSGLTGWSSYNGATPTVQTATNIPIYQNTLKTVLNLVSSSTVSVGNYGGTSQGVSMTAGVTYTISYYARSLSGNMTLKFSFQNGAGDENNMSHSNIITSEWIRYTYTATLNTAKNVMYVWNSSTASAVFQITDLQIEAKSYATTFTTGTRGTTVATGGGWKDLVGSNNGELVNGLRESSNNLGSLLFDGTDDHILGTIPSSTFSGAHSICCWFYRETVTQWAGLFSNNVNTTSCSIFTFISTSNTLGTNQAGVSGASIAVDLGADHLNKWIYAVITYAGATNGSAVNVYAYKNGSLLSATGSLYWNLSTSSSYYIGRHWTSATQILDGFIPQVQVYNRALTAAEVKQNFDAHRGRYGL